MKSFFTVRLDENIFESRMDDSQESRFKITKVFLILSTLTFVGPQDYNSEGDFRTTVSLYDFFTQCSVSFHLETGPFDESRSSHFPLTYYYCPDTPSLRFVDLLSLPDVTYFTIIE